MISRKGSQEKMPQLVVLRRDRQVSSAFPQPRSLVNNQGISSLQERGLYSEFFLTHCGYALDDEGEAQV